MKEKDKIKKAKDKVREVLDKEDCAEFVVITNNRFITCAKSQATLCVWLETLVDNMAHKCKIDKDVIKQAFDLGMIESKEEKSKYMEKMVLSSLKDLIDDMSKNLED